MVLSNVTHPGTGKILLGAGMLCDEPGTVWKQRTALPSESVRVLERAPIMCIEDGQLKIDLDVIDAIEETTEEGKLLRRFKDAMLKKNIPHTRKSKAATPRNTRAENDVIKTVGCIRVRESDLNAPCMVKLAKKRKTEEPRRDQEQSCQSQEHVMTTSTDYGSPYGNLSQRIDFMRVPDGVSSLDKLDMFDVEAKKKIPDQYSIKLPSNSYDGMKLDFACPPREIKLLASDGTGYKVGGNAQKQHAVRLEVHRSRCTDKQCRLMGCNGDPAYTVFQGAASDDEIKAYEMHWVASRRAALRSQGLELRLLSSK